jgi:hypothetical protein
MGWSSSIWRKGKADWMLTPGKSALPFPLSFWAHSIKMSNIISVLQARLLFFLCLTSPYASPLKFPYRSSSGLLSAGLRSFLSPYFPLQVSVFSGSGFHFLPVLHIFDKKLTFFNLILYSWFKFYLCGALKKQPLL